MNRKSVENPTATMQPKPTSLKNLARLQGRPAKAGSSLHPLLIPLGSALLSLVLLRTAHAAVNFSVSPNIVGNNYVGPVTFTITGLTNTEKVVVQNFAD